MDTTYYRFETRKVKVSGGADLAVLVPAAVASPAGEVLDFDRCRRKLETRAAWNGLAKAAAEVKFQAGGDGVYEAVAGGDLARLTPADAPVERLASAKTAFSLAGISPEKRPRKSAPEVKAPRAARKVRMARSLGWLELCASVATILVCVCAGWAFLALV